MNLKSKAISEIRATIETLNAHTECTDRIEGLQVLLRELEANGNSRINSLLTVIENGLDEHITLLKEVNKGNQYNNIDMWDYQTAAESNEALVELRRLFDPISQMQPEWVSVKDGYPETGTKCYFYRKGTSDFVYTGNYNGIDQWGESYFKEDNEDAYYRDVTHYLPFLKPQPPTK